MSIIAFLDHMAYFDVTNISIKSRFAQLISSRRITYTTHDSEILLVILLPVFVLLLMLKARWNDED